MRGITALVCVGLSTVAPSQWIPPSLWKAAERAQHAGGYIQDAPKHAPKALTLEAGSANGPDGTSPTKEPEPNAPKEDQPKMSGTDLTVAVCTAFIAFFSGVQVFVLIQQRQKMQDAVAESKIARENSEKAATENARIASEGLNAAILAANAAKESALAAMRNADISEAALHHAERAYFTIH